MDDDGIRYIQFQDEESRLRYIIAKFKEHDKKRGRYINHLIRVTEQQKEKIQRLEKLTERQHEEIEELMNAYDGAKPLIADRKHRAYVYELLKRATESSNYKNQCDNLANTNKQLSQHNQELKEKVNALETIIKNLHNGK